MDNQAPKTHEATDKTQPILALLDLDGSPVDAEDLDLPYTGLGDSDSLEVGDQINIFGYPGIGGETITFTSGNVSGFTHESGVQGRAWIKTDATIAGGNSGGTAVDEDGLLVGVPTQGGVTDEIVDARPVADTNGDGVVDGQDSAVPIGGFINALRPVNLALPLVEQARSGVTVERDAPDREAYEGDATLGRLFFASEINDVDLPVDVVTSLPSDSRSLYLFFDYEGMVDGVIYSMKTYLDGQEAEDWGLPPSVWNGGETGMWWSGRWPEAGDGGYWISVNVESGLAPGRYRLELYIEGELKATSDFWAVGDSGGKTGGASFGEIIFAEGVTRRGDPVGETDEFPSGTEKVHIFSDYEGMQDGLDLAEVWYIDDVKVLEIPYEWEWGNEGTFYDYIYSESGGLLDGAYSVELIVEGQVLQSGEVTLGEGRQTRPPEREEPEGVVLEGYVKDADTMRAIRGALFIVLKPDVRLRDFEWDESQVLVLAETDRNGYFELEEPLDPAGEFSILVAAEDYEPIGGDDISIEELAAELPLEVFLESQ